MALWSRFSRTKESFPLPGPIAGLAAWYGRKLKGHEDWAQRLSAHDLKEIDGAIRSFRASGAPLAAIAVACSLTQYQIIPALAATRR